jgi:hypothetical protein
VTNDLPNLRTTPRQAREDLPSAAGDPARAALLQEYDCALTGGPYSVTFKTLSAPSGDKHDFFSVGPYWWPNPDTPDGSPYVRRDGMVNPEVLELDGHALRNMVGDVTRLLLAGQLLDKPEACARAALLLRTWFLNEETRMNPHLEYGQAITGICSGRGIGIIDTASLCGLLWQLSLAGNFPGWTPEDHAGLKRWFANFLDWMLNSRLGNDESREHNNHGTWYDAQVCAYASFVGERALIGKQLEGSLPARIHSQIADDGSMPHELSRTLPVHYSLFNLQGFLFCALVGHEIDMDLFRQGGGIGEKLTATANWFCRDLFDHSDVASSQLRPLRKVLAIWAFARLSELAGNGPWDGLSQSTSPFSWQRILYRQMRADEYLVTK